MAIHAEDFVSGRSLAATLGDPALSSLTPGDRDAVWHHFEPLCRSRVMCESEKGVDGQVIEGSVEIWNAEEFAPWTFKAPLTVICGSLRFEEPVRRDAKVRIERSACLFVGSLFAGHLRVEGELHILGALDVLELEIAPGGFVSGMVATNGGVQSIESLD